MREVPPTPSITWGEQGTYAKSVKRIEGIYYLTALIQRLSSHGWDVHLRDERDRLKFFSQVHVNYEGREYNIGEDLLAFYRDEPVPRNKRAQKDLKRFFTVNFPNFPHSGNAPVAERG